MRTILLFPMLLTSATWAASLTNAIDGVGPSGNYKPWICIQNEGGTVTLPLKPGETGDANKASGNGWYIGATLRFGGCSTSNTYLGYTGILVSDNSATNSISTYAPPEGVHIAWQNPSVNNKGVVGGGIRYTPIATDANLPTPTPAGRFRFAGINLSGLEFGKVPDPVVVPNLSQEDADTPLSDLAETTAFIKGGMNTVRLPVGWGYLQPEGAGKGGIDKNYYDNYVRPALVTLTRSGVYTMLDLHAYMRYSAYGKEYSGCGMEGACPDGKLVVDADAWESVWGQLYDRIRKDNAIDQRFLMLDLVNEPVGVPDDKVFTIQTALIRMLRNKGFEGYILIEGNNWSGLHSWSTASWQGSDGTRYTNATLFTRANFQREGIADLSRILINVHQYLDADYSGTQGSCQQNLKTRGTGGFNLDAFTQYRERSINPTCLT